MLLITVNAIEGVNLKVAWKENASQLGRPESNFIKLRMFFLNRLQGQSKHEFQETIRLINKEFGLL